MESVPKEVLNRYARELRRGMTQAETQLWYRFLRLLTVRVHRQYVLGSFIADFYVPKAKLVIEADGGQHYEPEGLRKDEERTAYLNSLGLKVVRYSDTEILKSFPVVCEELLRVMTEQIGEAVCLREENKRR